MFRIKILAIGAAMLFFIFGLATLADYGVNWDATTHLMRGQAYLHYYLTGKNDYSDILEWDEFRKKDEAVRTKNPTDIVPRYRLYWQKPDTIFFSPDINKDQVPRVSMYMLDKDLAYISQHYDYGHPHISDVLSSASNYIFYQKLGLINDIDSYRVYGVFLAACLVGLVFWWTASLYGTFAGIFAALALSTYPLFWAESHFNTEKDIPETVFWSFMLYTVWRGITGKNWKWILVSGIFFGLALGTKFNILFSLFIIVPWLVIYLFLNQNTSQLAVGMNGSQKNFPEGILSSLLRSSSLSNKTEMFLQKQKKLLLSLLVAPFLGVSIYMGTWPYFWEDIGGKVIQVISFYRTIGTANSIDPSFIGPLGVNTYPLFWILYTTPLVTLLFSVLGVAVLISRIGKEKKKESLFFLLWLIIPIVRVTLPGTNIYGGVRQIMEYIPAMAIIAGVGVAYFAKLLPHYIPKFFLVFLFIPIIFKLIEIHPNENVYFNPLIGGLAGAKEQNFPSWGVSFGAPYRKAIEWVNNNAEPGAKLTLGAEILSNIPSIFIRPDIDYKSNRSGYLRQGEYVISLRFDGAGKRSYFDMYLDKMIEPVYEEKVDGVSILKIWKNDLDHLKSEWKNEKVLENIKFTKNENGLSFDIGHLAKLSRLELTYDERNCPELSWGYTTLSKDGIDWERQPGVYPDEVKIRTLGTQPKDGKFIDPFVGQEAQYIHIILSPTNTCLTQVKNAVLYTFP